MGWLPNKKDKSYHKVIMEVESDVVNVGRWICLGHFWLLLKWETIFGGCLKAEFKPLQACQYLGQVYGSFSKSNCSQKRARKILLKCNYSRLNQVIIKHISVFFFTPFEFILCVAQPLLTLKLDNKATLE